ncbi:MAG: AraC family transcriptional regulator ligand-binding domain-containing protein [Pseudomonadota bacterium]
MDHALLRVPARYYARLADVLVAERIDLAPVLREVRLPVDALTRPNAMLSLAQVERLLAGLRVRSMRTDLGFEVGKLLSVSAHSFVGFGMLNSPNVAQALHFMSRHFRLIMPSFSLRFVCTTEHGELHFSPTVAMSHEALLFHIEAIGMAGLREVRDLSDGRMLEAQLDLAMPPPPHADRYRALPRLKVNFHSELGPAVRLRVSGNLDALPIISADTSALRVAEERCRLLIEQATEAGGLGELIAMAVRESGDGPPSEEEIARMFNISRRTLNRYLKQEQTSFRDISRNVQHTLACERLDAQQMSISEIAYSLGFSDAANFTRAFRNIQGCSPRAFQRRAI